jgi:hypothetical protein
MNNGKLILPRLLVCVAIGMAGAMFLVSLFIIALESVWVFIDEHPTYTGLSILFIISCFGLWWMVKYIKR